MDDMSNPQLVLGASSGIALAEQLRYLVVMAASICNRQHLWLLPQVWCSSGTTGRTRCRYSSGDAGLRICGFGRGILRALPSWKLPGSGQNRIVLKPSASLQLAESKSFVGSSSRWSLDVFDQCDLAGFCKGTIRLFGTQRCRPAGFLNDATPLIAACRLEFCQNFSRIRIAL